jgi:hypothetical protein
MYKRGASNSFSDLYDARVRDVLLAFQREQNEF